MTTLPFGRLLGLRLQLNPLGLAGSLVLTLALVTLAKHVTGVGWDEALLGGLAGTLLHWLAALVHQLGHAWAANRTGWPMLGIELGTFGLLDRSLYPADEPMLPGTVHVRRALGGPAASLLLSIAALAAVVFVQPPGSLAWWLGVYFFLDTFLVFFLGAFLPLGFTDGSTILSWWGRE